MSHIRRKLHLIYERRLGYRGHFRLILLRSFGMPGISAFLSRMRMTDSCILLMAVSMRSRRQFIQLHPSRRISFFSIFMGNRLLGIEGLPFKFISRGVYAQYPELTSASGLRQRVRRLAPCGCGRHRVQGRS